MSILLDADTTFIVQGITGREAVNLTRECLDYGAGAKIVGGVTPGRRGRVRGKRGHDRAFAQELERRDRWAGSLAPRQKLLWRFRLLGPEGRQHGRVAFQFRSEQGQGRLVGPADGASAIDQESRPGCAFEQKDKIRLHS